MGCTCCQRYGYFVPLIFGCLFFFGSIGFDFLISMGINEELGKVCPMSGNATAVFCQQFSPILSLIL